MKTNQKEKKQRNEASQDELLKAITALEEIVMAKMPKEWEEEEKVAEKVMLESLRLTSLHRKALASPGRHP
jgi:hypothetical protein